jgi:protein-tyrosine phosphatase
MPESTRLDLSWVHKDLAVGGRFSAKDVSCMARDLSIRHVVDVREEAWDEDQAALLQTHDVTLLHLPIPDHGATATKTLGRGVSWVAARIERGERVLVHCEYGVGRSVLLGLCVLVSLGLPPLEAMMRVKLARPCASPSPAQLEAFLRWVAPSNQRLPSWEELARIAYSRGFLPAGALA